MSRIPIIKLLLEAAMLNFDKIIRKYPATVSLSVKYMNLASALALNFVFGLVYVRNKIINQMKI